MPEVPQYQTKFAGRPQAKFTPIGFQVPDIDPATATDKAIEGLSQVATKTIIGALKEKQVFIRQQEITKETNELMNDMSSFMTNLEENATSLREGNEPWSDVYGREWGKKTQEMQNRIDTMPPGKVRDTIQDYFAQDVGKRSVVIASEAEQREDRDFVDNVRTEIKLAGQIGGAEGLQRLEAAIDNSETKPHLFAKETLLELYYNTAQDLHSDEIYNMIVSYDSTGRPNFTWNYKEKDDDDAVPTSLERQLAYINKTNASQEPVPSVLTVPPSKLTEKQIKMITTLPKLMDSYYEANAGYLNTYPEKWPQELIDHDKGHYSNVVELAENRTWREIGKDVGVSILGVSRTKEEAQALLEKAYGVNFVSTSLSEHGERSSRVVVDPGKKKELKALVRKELLAGKTIEEIYADINESNKPSTGKAYE
ncbi:MAG: hypothetical protein Unbinned6201contig1000_22 [Prokaryotic dsDNA virus sp.]|nr:MAG: hypothetical protein Unbinned6201contig1000_22 [Prokaryotic dsDNA virus sp.]